MAGLEDRVGALEGRMDHHAAMLGDIRGEMRQLGSELRGEMGQVRGEVHGLRDDMKRRFETVDQRFAWLVGIQMGTLVPIIGGLVGVLYR